MVDVRTQIDSVTRGLHSTQIDGEPAGVQTLAQEYSGGLADVWDAVTDPERIPRWFLPVSGDLRLGGRYQLEGQAGGEVLACEPPVGDLRSRGRWRRVGRRPAGVADRTYAFYTGETTGT